MTKKVKLPGGPQKTVTWIWLDPETGGQLKVEYYDFSELAPQMFGNHIAYTITVSEMDKLLLLSKQNMASVVASLSESFKSYFEIRHWLEEKEIKFSVEIKSWA